MRYAVCLVTLMLYPVHVAGAEETERLPPSFIIILCDNLGYGDVGDSGRPGAGSRPAGRAADPAPLLLGRPGG